MSSTECEIHVRCEGRLKGIEDTQKQHGDMLRQVHDVLLVGNGSPSLVTQIANNRLFAKAALWVSAVVFIALVTGFVGLLVK